MLIRKDYYWFGVAKNIAMKSTYHHQKIGCIAVFNNKLIAQGFNQEKTHPIQKRYNAYRDNQEDVLDALPKLHAEITCLNQLAGKNIPYNKVKIYIYRIKINKIDKNNIFSVGMARPCPACMEYIKSFGIKNIYFSTNEGFAYERLEYRKNV